MILLETVTNLASIIGAIVIIVVALIIARVIMEYLSKLLSVSVSSIVRPIRRALEERKKVCRTCRHERSGVHVCNYAYRCKRYPRVFDDYERRKEK